MLHLAAILSAWLQYEADGQAHARAVATTACPAVTADEQTLPMRTRAGASKGFNDIVCDALVPQKAKRVRVGSRPIPAPVADPERIAVLGDTGCRIKGWATQNCKVSEDWPFPVTAHTIAGLRPDLIIDVGDYLYRETVCPPLHPGCAGSPYGDIAQAWNADWFAPAAPLFASAPLVLTRGNHEECRRSGPGWFRYLDAGTETACTPISRPYAVDFPGLRLAVFDSAAADDQNLYNDVTPEYEQDFTIAEKLMDGASGDRWFLTHRPPYLNVNERNAMGARLRRFSAVLAGHIHLFSALNVQGNPPLVINGEGGDNLDETLAPFIPFGLGSLHAAGAPFTQARFGFGLYTRTTNGWTISLRDVTGGELARCALAQNSVLCKETQSASAAAKTSKKS